MITLGVGLAVGFAGGWMTAIVCALMASKGGKKMKPAVVADPVLRASLEADGVVCRG